MVICTRRGCGVDYDPASDAATTSDACLHHPGAPVFHEGMKSWSCCNTTSKPVLEFDQFLAIPGCATAQGHTAEKQSVPTVKSGKVVDPQALEEQQQQQQQQAASSSANQQAVTQPLSGNTLAAATNAKHAAAAKAGSSNANDAATAWREVEDPQDKTDVQIPAGAKCKRSGCAFEHPGGARQRQTEECRYHRGSPIFHEGSKGWSCCKRRVLDFNDFLAIEPCTTSTSGHLLFGASAPATSANGSGAAAAAGTSGEEAVDCRMDHYETPNDVRLTVYAKNVQSERSRIAFRADAVEFDLVLPALPTSASGNARRFTKTLAPFSDIDPAASSFVVSKFKVDLVLVKAQKGQSWPALERGDKVVGYGLTFGRDKDK
ncbi:uncharacterized protein PFL1_01849 [Pseudozyma flocculosa PF-1]|uniref:Related to diploid state maintenance protein chpA n=1 Tax=Pseudozyma flocculosa TaxID=84751 RepID=A0A5C3EYP6_9BASI|nr:uncharacterized protein PFL1_01849 [Pseudozyma flocculosa PF-1]EPQ30323.1 hypothetical protein PFL1_01849 [Pseudozyma flocculosa PF-1]SPO37393.1 related to diploid state maintenance protein chpA [Pseudozyma flocculosa]